MKFKKVEISAFRIYDDAKDATFDFSINETTTADFISLYAPNGYGKTSFYDAVEWGMTNNIQRFWQNKSITNSAIDALKNQSDTQVKLWRNIHSKHPTYVKILGEGIEPINRQLKPHGNKKSDAEMDGGESLVNRTFRHVILSQEWISAFLREIDGNRRYEIFMDNPELKEVNSYYKNLKALLAYCQNNISIIGQKISEEEKRVSALESENVLDKINQQIDILIEKFKQSGLYKLTLATTREDVSKLKNLIAERLISFSDDSMIREKLEWLSVTKIGANDYVGIRTYFELEARNKIIVEAQRNIRGILAKFTETENKSNEIAALNKLLIEKETHKSNILTIISQYEEYLRVAGLLLSHEARSNVLLADINNKTIELDNLEIQEAKTKVELNRILAEINEANLTIAGLPERLLLIKKNEQDIVIQNEKITEIKTGLKPLESQVKTIDAEIEAFKKAIADLRNGTYSKMLIDDQDLASSTDAILINQEALVKSNERLTALNERIADQEKLKSELSAFVRQGLDIVNKDRNRNHCPLCEQAFNSHQQLAERIANNTTLDKILQDLFIDKNKLEQEVSRLVELIKSAMERLLLYFEEKIIDKRILLSTVSREVKSLKETNASYESTLETMQNDLRELMMQQLGLSHEAYEQELNSNLSSYKKKEEELNNLLKKQNQTQKILNDILAKSRDELKLLIQIIEALNQSEQYRAVLAWFQINFNTEEASIDILQNELVENELLIKEYFEKIGTLRVEQENITLELSAYDQQAEEKKLYNLVSEKERADAKMDGFRSLLKDKLDIESQFIDFKTLSATLDLKEQGFKLSQITNKSLLEEYSKIEKYADHINEFLRSENAKIQLQNLASEKEFLEQNVRSLLIKEVEKTKSFLQIKVKEFFFEDLINDLYQKIDPHPDFKEVHFSADFDADSPRLDVFVRDRMNKKADLIPNLYFSTAQINILSLSIFLASALNTPDYNCIFIDDPIQSMDSVNILSTIDLLRSLVLNYNKQIILSTHDETFFNLLKKKMPPGQFKSKFLELESVGRVKVEV
ncbi:hypothetical protein DCC81_17945 [Chitinophaga parva]|uniref:Rad50/SbcC-type AAA domain-containing protein n=1 Tax=Chitinophaga parva TaxID=2169414 RepID=A0A2T7BIK3_9BACT|nr:AAA family ATPase [Chitinophaga parva]PUZ26121.1 hypothetical protein DCC81_17945 [Chitinophaga parva]